MLVRFCHHETPEDWQAGIALIERLHLENIPVMVAVLQDRQACLESCFSWRAFLRTVVGAVGDKVSQVEVTHAKKSFQMGAYGPVAIFKDLMRPVLELQRGVSRVFVLSALPVLIFEYLAVFISVSGFTQRFCG